MTTSGGYEPVLDPQRSNRRSEKRQLTEVVAIRMTVEDKARYVAAAAAHHMSLPELFRLSVEAALIQEEIHGG